MSAIYTTRATERLSRRLQRAGKKLWVAVSTGDSWGKYLIFRVGGPCVGAAGWTLREAQDRVAAIVSEETD